MFLVVANMIGAGVFTTSGYSLASLGSPSLVVWAWGVAGAIALAGAFSYGQLVHAMPESGGEYLFLSRAAHPLLGFIAGWVSLIAGFSGAIAFAATTLEQYAVPIEYRPSWLPQGAIAIMSIVVAGLSHGFRPQAGAWFQNLIVVLKLILLAGVLTFAASKIPFDIHHDQSATLSKPEGHFSLAVAFAGSLVWISLSYSGFNAAVYLAGEVDNVERVVSKSMLVATGMVAVLYLLLNSVFVFANAPEAIVGRPGVAAVTARSLGGQGFETFVRWTIVACLLTSVFSMMMAAPRVYAKMADDGLLPGVFRFADTASHAGDRAQSPRVATLFQMVLAIILVSATTLQGLLSYLGLTLSLSAAGSVACLFLPSIRKQRHWSSRDLIPIFYIVATVVSATMLTISKPMQLVGTAVTFLTGVAAYMLAKHWR